MTNYQWALLGIASSSVIINVWIAAHLFLRRGGEPSISLLYPPLRLNPASGYSADGAELSLLNQGGQFVRGLDDGQAASGIHAARQVKDGVSDRGVIDRQKSYLIDGNGKIAQVDDFYRDPGEAGTCSSGRVDIHNNAQPHPVAADKPAHVAQAQYQSGSRDSQQQPILQCHTSASLSKERPACPCNLLL